MERGDLNPKRDLVYVKDTAKGFLEVSKCDDLIGEEVNIATQNEISIGELAKEIIGQINPDAEIVQDEERMRPEKSEVYRLYGSNEKLKQYTGWQPEYSLKDGIAEAIEWYGKEENLKQFKADIYNI